MDLKIDMHIHTKFSYDSDNRVEDIVRVAKERGLDGVGLVDHDTIAGFGEMIRIGKEHDLIVIPGVEVRVKGGYLLAYGDITELPPKGEDPARAVSILRKKDVLVVAVHPFKNGLGLKDRVYSLRLDAIETANGGAIFGDKSAEKAAETLKLPRIGGSDAHFLYEIGDVVVVVKTSSESPKDILEAIRKGDTYIIQKKNILKIVALNIIKSWRKIQTSRFLR